MSGLARPSARARPRRRRSGHANMATTWSSARYAQHVGRPGERAVDVRRRLVHGRRYLALQNGQLARAVPLEVVVHLVQRRVVAAHRGVGRL